MKPHPPCTGELTGFYPAIIIPATIGVICVSSIVICRRYEPDSWGRIRTKTKIKERFSLVEGYPNLFVLEADPFLSNYGSVTTLAQTFVDLWNLSDWYAKEFIKALKEKIDELLSSPGD